MKIQKIREQFPILKQTVYGNPLVYLDNAATSHKPLAVIGKEEYIEREINSNLHRAVHHLANLSTQEFESTRKAIAEFINAKSEKEIVFTSGATASLNLVAYSLGEKLINKGDAILISEEEHHSNIVPWQLLAKRKCAIINTLPIDDNGYLRIEELDSLIESTNAKILCISHVSNVLGIVNPIKKIVETAHKRGCIVVVDGAQGAVHCNIDVTNWECDFYAFSGHKLYAACGTGVLYGKKELLDSMPPFMGGGEMIETVKWDGTTFAEAPYKFEAGTQNISGVPTLKEALKLIENMRGRENLLYEKSLKEYVLQEIGKRKNIHLFGVPRIIEDKIPLFSISVDGIHHEDLALILDKMGIAVRSGKMCAEPLMDRLGVTGLLRFSFAPYNTIEEAQYLFESLDKAIMMLS